MYFGHRRTYQLHLQGQRVQQARNQLCLLLLLLVSCLAYCSTLQPPKHLKALSDITTHKNVPPCILVLKGYFSPKMTVEAATELKHVCKCLIKKMHYGSSGNVVANGGWHIQGILYVPSKGKNHGQQGQANKVDK